ncbi:MAG: hypothetical protein LBK41_04220 [Clostridiales bacterium]|jgi:ABC-2 type transport system permease protein|nr:hypothetical protein [Clostridiales bacterium]
MILTLLRLQLRWLFSSMLKSGGRKRGMRIFIIAALIYAAFALGGSFWGIFASMLRPYFDGGVGWLYFAMAGIMTFSLCFTGTVFAAGSALFGARDNDTLLSLPIPTAYILLSRAGALLVLECAYSALIFIPALLIWAASPFAGAPGAVFLVLCWLLTLLFALAFSCLVGWITAMAGGWTRHGKLIRLAVSLLLFGSFMYGGMYMSQAIQSLTENGAEIAASVSVYLLPFYHMGRAAAEGDPLSFAIYALIVCACFGGAIWLISRGYLKLITSDRRTVRTEYAAERHVRAGGAPKALFMKELRRCWYNPMVMLNTAFPSFLAAAGAVFVVVRRGDALRILSEITGLSSSVSAAAIIAAALIMLSAMNLMTASLVSLEGRQLWIVKSLPVGGSACLMAKIHAQLAVSAAPFALASAAASAALSLPASGAALVIAAPLAFNILAAFVGLRINLRFPMLDWTNEIQPVKQSISTVLTMIALSSIVVAAVAIYLPLSGGVSAETYLWICSAVFAAASLLFWRRVRARGAEDFAKVGDGVG